MPLTPEQLKTVATFDVLYGVERFSKDGTSIYILGRRAEPFTDEDGFDAADAIENLHRALTLRAAKANPGVQAKRTQLKQEIYDIFAKAGFAPIYMEEIENEYWPDSYAALKYESPWFIVTTPAGHFRIGWRKRVLEIDWSRTAIKADGEVVFKDEDVTKGPRMIHAWGYAKAHEYLAKLVPA